MKELPKLPGIPRLEEAMVKRIISKGKEQELMSVDEFLKTKQNRPHEESGIQQACIRWFDLYYPKYRQLLFAIPNGGQRGIITAKIMKAEGVRRGIPDMFLAIPKLHWHGLFLEMKTPRGSLRPEQKQFIESVGKNYKCVVCRSIDEFMREVKLYLS